jgi:hypothetical protein
MIRVQVQFTDDELRALHDLARRSGRPVAAVVRDAVDALIRDDERQRHRAQALAAIGGFHSGLGDLAEQHDAYLEDADG